MAPNLPAMFLRVLMRAEGEMIGLARAGAASTDRDNSTAWQQVELSEKIEISIKIWRRILY